MSLDLKVTFKEKSKNVLYLISAMVGRHTVSGFIRSSPQPMALA